LKGQQRLGRLVSLWQEQQRLERLEQPWQEQQRLEQLEQQLVVLIWFGH
jgi:hypothetical protein